MCVIAVAVHVCAPSKYYWRSVGRSGAARQSKQARKRVMHGHGPATFLAECQYATTIDLATSSDKSSRMRSGPCSSEWAFYKQMLLPFLNYIDHSE
jgi:hypothetical protein